VDLRSDGYGGRVAVSAIRRGDVALMAASVAPLVYTLFDSSNGDVPLYHHCAERLLGGSLPYRDWVFEYPPYALLWFLLPAVMHGYAGFRALFSLQVLALDLVAKAVLLREGDRMTPGGGYCGHRLAPFLVFSFLGLFQTYFYLKRLDPISSALVVLALVAFASERMATAGALLAVAAATKLYPALAAPALLCLAYRRGNAVRFVGGFAAALVPLAFLSVELPWWRFASFQAARGIQVESTYGSVLWLLHFFGMPATWIGRPGCCVEIQGPAALILTPIARVLFGTATLGAVGASVAVAARGAQRAAREPSAGFAGVGRIVLLPIVAFMVTSLALSPQFAIWPVGPTALAIPRGRRAPLAALAVAVMLTVFVFPAPGYFGASNIGISLARTATLVARNGSLVVALVLLALEAAAGLAAARATSAADGTVPQER
jgi:hypothetical protein